MPFALLKLGCQLGNYSAISYVGFYYKPPHCTLFCFFVDDVPAPVVDCFTNDEKPEENSFKTDLLVPEVSMVQRSPLLKLDSPVAENPLCDPFATGSTPPVAPFSVGILEPEQVETNLIQF